MNGVIPHYYENRITLVEMDSMFQEFVGGPHIVDIGETIRVMLADYFYGELIAVPRASHIEQDRTIVFPSGYGYTLQGQDLSNAMSALGEVFWALADLITERVLRVNENYTHRPNECFYKFFPFTRELIVYTPALLEAPRFGLVPLDGRAVMLTCQETLPSWLRR